MEKNRNLIRDKNIALLKRFLFKQKEALKSEMADETGLSVVTVNTLTKQLLEEETILEGNIVQQPIGRPATTFFFNYNKKYHLLISIQEKKDLNTQKLIIIGKIVNLACEVKYEEIISFEEITIHNFKLIIQHFINLNYEIDKIGISLPGKIYNDVVISSWENLFDHWNIKNELSKITSIPIFIQNDAHILTVGHSLSCNLNKEETIVGIFYPQNSMPGISIYSKGNLVEGGHNLAGEAKYLPHLIQSGAPKNSLDLTQSLIEIITIYNVVIAPNSFIISTESINKEDFLTEIKHSEFISKQINQPQIYFVDDFQNSLTTGLQWLVMKNSIYTL